MVQSTDAKIWFGFCWDEKDQEYYENGLPNPVVAYMKSVDSDIEDTDDAERAVDKILEKFGCKLVRHCYCDGADMMGLAVTESCETASRGYPINLTTTGMITTGTVADAWISKLTLAAQAIGWPYKRPSWWLASYWY
jgi:hypothetical protein